jgi:hypothetical protein
MGVDVRGLARDHGGVRFNHGGGCFYSWGVDVSRRDHGGGCFSFKEGGCFVDFLSWGCILLPTT